jgi:hypothetical protein
MDMQTTQAAGQDQPQEVDPKVAAKSKKIVRMLKARVEKTERIRKDLIKSWAYNVDYRRGKPFGQDSDEERVNVNIDWSMTKAKHAQLFSQVPTVYLTPKQDQFKPAMSAFGKELNNTLTTSRIGVAMDEATIDAINASGFGAVIAGYDSMTEQKEIPSINPTEVPPQLQAALLQGKLGGDAAMLPAQSVLSYRHYVTRISPSDFLWPLDFTGSDFDDADFVGRSGQMLWSEGKRRFKLADADKSKVASTKGASDNLRQDYENQQSDDPTIDFKEIFYWAYRFDPECTSFDQINHLVLVDGLDDPAIHEPWSGQRLLENGKYAGACKFPIRVLTLTYVSDDAIPPSDTAIGRPQVNEMIKSRSQIVMQRGRSLPIRWYDVNRLGVHVQDSLNRGTYQEFIPTNGAGDKAIGEVARASYPQEDYGFDAIIKQDLQEQWQVGSNQMGMMNKGRRSAAEANITQQNFQTRVGYERARVADFFVGIAEVMAGILAITGDFQILGQNEIAAIDQTWDRGQIAGEYVYWIRPDATVLLDAPQRIDRLMKYINLVGKSGYVNLKPIIEEITALSGLEPEKIIIDPHPPAPPQPNISFRFSGIKDLTEPLVLALLMRGGMAPDPQLLEQAKGLLKAAGLHEPTPPQVGAPGPIGEHPPADAQPQWQQMPKVFKRSADMGA